MAEPKQKLTLGGIQSSLGTVLLALIVLPIVLRAAIPYIVIGTVLMAVLAAAPYLIKKC